MLTKPRTVVGALPNNTQTFYCAPAKWKSFQEIAKSLGMSASELLRRDIDGIIAEYQGGELKVEFDLDAKKAERVKLKKTEYTLAKLLQDEVSDKSRSAYDTMIYFAVELGSDAALEKNIDEVLKQLHGYECRNGRDSFNQSTLETFIEYVEAVLKRRVIENEIKLYRRQKLQDK